LECPVDGKPVNFTATEIEGIEQIISAGHKWIDGTNPAYPDLILKLGRAFLEVQGEGKGQELYLSEMEAWYLREIVPTNMRVRGESIGMAIKKKLYPLLLEFSAERYSNVALSRFGYSTIEEPLTREDAIREEIEEAEADPDLAEEGCQDGPAGITDQIDITDTSQPEDFPPPQDSQEAGQSENVDVDNPGPNKDQPSE
jgi:hypothetical protein